jgi:hypothetical protein
MKKYINIPLVCSVALVLVSGLTLGQENYTVKMKVKAEGLPAEYAAYAEQDVTTYIKGDNLKSERSGMMASSITYYDGKKMTSLTEAMGNKTGFTATKEELEAFDKTEKTEKPKIEYIAEKKMVAGYECSKALITSMGKDKKENVSTVWCTDKIKYAHSQANKGGKGMLDLSELKGYPLAMEMSMNQNGMEMKIIMTATEILTSPIDDSVFAINTDGYKMMTYKEMIEKQKMMMQGGGQGR